jgi:hypothetical protein
MQVNSIFKSSAALLISVLSLSIHAEAVQFQNIRVGGTGCPSEKTQIAYAPDNSAATLIFQDFQSHVPVEASGPKVVKTISQLPCNVFFEIKVPMGQKLDSLEVKYDMRGNTSLDRGVQGYFKSFLMSTAGLGTERTRRGPELLQEKIWSNSSVDQFEDFALETIKKINFGSDCRAQNGQDRVVLHLQHHILTQIQRGYETSGAQGTIMMDTSDMTGGLKLIATTSACNGGGGNPTPGRICRTVNVGGRLQQICK